MTRLISRLGPAVLFLLCLPAAKAQQKVPAPEEVELKDRNGLPMTKDGLLIKATFYPGLNKEKSIPIILLHGYKGSRIDFATLALFLQTEHGHAVLVPDLRGHGDSTTVMGRDKPLDAEKLGPNDFDLMVSDMEACKKFLVEKNNAKQLNIEKLCLVGAEMGAVVAMNWAVQDWSWPILTTGKQGQDVRALVLLSPLAQVERGRLNMSAAASSPLQKNFSIAMLYGSVNSRKYGADAKKLQSLLNKWHPNQEKEQTFFLDALMTSLQGTKLLTAPGMSVDTLIEKFIELRLVNKDFPWRERASPLGQ